jgi:uncharacterized protein (DUF4415 family)
MPGKRAAGGSTWTDPDDAPALDEAFFQRADVFEGDRLVRRGRPPLERPKRQVTLRLDQDVLEALRATGPGWQTRANTILAEWLGRRKAG